MILIYSAMEKRVDLNESLFKAKNILIIFMINLNYFDGVLGWTLNHMSPNMASPLPDIYLTFC